MAIAREFGWTLDDIKEMDRADREDVLYVLSLRERKEAADG